MKTPTAAVLLILILSFLGSPLFGQSSVPAQLRAQLTSDDPKARASALTELGKLGAVAKSEVPTIEKCIKEPPWDVRYAALRALPKIVGPAEAAKTFDRIARDPVDLKSAGGALIGLQECGSLGLPTLAWALKSQKDEVVRNHALITAAIIDTEGTLYNDVLPMLVGQDENVTLSTRKYLLAHGIRKYYSENSRWPADFIEIETYIRKANPLITLAPLTKFGQLRFEPGPDGALNIRTYSPQPDGTLKTGTYFVIQKPQKK